jgi:hypothetical protein
MGDERRTTSPADDLAQIERDWMLAQERIDELTEAGKQEIQRFLQDIMTRAEDDDDTPDQQPAEV